MNISFLSKISIGFFLIALSASGCSDDELDGIKNPGPPQVRDPAAVSTYLSNPDGSAKLSFFDNLVFEGPSSNADAPTIVVDRNNTFQTIDGFGYTLTGGSAILLNDMSNTARANILNELFTTNGNGIGTSYLRISIGSSDLDPATFSYNDLPPGQTDEDLSEFSLAPDQEDLIPVLQQILTLSPNMKIMGSPWSAPVWMKTNGNTIGGSLLPQYYGVYAQYFVKYIEGMEAEGIVIDAITIQNEPLHGGNNPSMIMTAVEQADFIKNHLGPAFAQANITTKIVAYDHNADVPEYPISIFDDPAANPYVEGSAFHLYGGSINNLSQVHNAHPDKSLYFTEQWIGAPGNFAADLRWNVRELTVGATRNWCKCVLQWNLAADPNNDPHTPGGCTLCLGAITIDGNAVTRNTGYYTIGHAAKFVVPGSVRVQTEMPSNLQNVAFLTPSGKLVLIVLNNTDNDQNFNIDPGDGQIVSTSLKGGAVATYVW